MLMNALAFGVCFLAGLPGWETSLDSSQSQVIQQAIVHGCTTALARQPQGHAAGRYVVQYVRPDQIHTAFQSSLKTWFTPECYHAVLSYSQHDEDAVESIVIRNRNVIYSSRHYRDSRIPPFALATGVYQQNTLAVEHNLVVDPSRLALEMNFPKEVPLDRLHFYQQRNGLIRMHYRAVNKPHPVVSLVWYDPAQGYLPLKQMSFHPGPVIRKLLEIEFGWRLINDEWNCCRVKQIRYESQTHEGETYPERHSEVVYDKVATGGNIDPVLFELSALKLKAGDRIADFRRDAVSGWLPYQPDGDPYEKRLDAMLADYTQLTTPLPRVAPWIWTWVIVGCLIALPLLLFPSIGLHLFRVVHVPQRLVVR